MPRWFETRPPSAPPLYCVVGQPVAHSLSPEIHAAFAAQTGRRLDYERVEVAPGELAAAVAEFREIGGRGLNVTVPLKEEAWALAQVRRPRAAAAAAANTLWFDARGAVIGDNTDGAGLVSDLEQNLGVTIADRRILLLGAGGAARGVLPELCARHPAAILVSNRDAARAEALAQRTRADAVVEVLPWGATPRVPIDLLINATAASLAGQVPPLAPGVVHADCVCYDMMYGDAAKLFLQWARSRGARETFDGLGMLVEQAAVAFALWHGIKPATAPVIAALRASLSGG